MDLSPLGWLHTLGSLPAIPLAIYMLAKHGRIVPDSRAGRGYFWCMVLGILTVYPIARAPVSVVFATVTLAVLLLGYGLSRRRSGTRFGAGVGMVSLTISVFLLMLPTVSETLRRLPVGDPVAKSLQDPILLGAQGALALTLVVGIALQMLAMRRRNAAPAKAGG